MSNRNLSTMVGFRPRNEYEVQEIQAAADHASLDVASYIRTRVIRVARKENLRRKMDEAWLARERKAGEYKISNSQEVKQ